MNSFEMVVDFIVRHPGASTKAIMAGTGLGPYALRHILVELTARDLIRQERTKAQPLCWWACQARAIQSTENANWCCLQEKAEALEKKAFWHRAANVWLAAFDATENEVLRRRATLRRTACLQKAARPHEVYDGIAMASVEGVDTWSI